MMTMQRRVFKNAFLLIFSGFFTQFISFLAVIYVANVLGAESFGKLNFAMAVTTYFGLLGTLGLTRQGTKEIARRPERAGEFITNILSMRLCLSVFAILALLITASILNKSHDVKELIYLFGLGLLPTAFLIDWAFQGLERMEYVALSRGISALFYFIFVFILVKDQRNLMLIPYVQFAATCIAALFLIICFNNGHPPLQHSVRFSTWPSLIGAAWPLGLAIILVQMINNIDVVLLGIFKSNSDVGYYSAAYKLIFVCILIIGNLFESLFPSLSRLYHTDPERFIHTQAIILKCMIALAVPLFIGGIIVSKFLILTLYGNSYSTSIHVFRILMLIPSLTCINSVFCWGFWAMDQHNEYLIVVLIQALVNVTCNLLFIPLWGMTGAGLATILSEVIGTPFYYILYRRHLRIYTKIADILKPVFASTVMAVALSALINIGTCNAPLLISTGVAVYVFSMYALRGFPGEELRSLSSLHT
jgi:O-antigen/teichoic acid export membrane protein